MASLVRAAQFTSLFPAIGSTSRSMSEYAAHVGLRIHQSLCGLRGHDRYLHVDGSRVTLQCVGCRHESPGWDTGARAYQRTVAGDPVRHRLR